MVDEKKGKAFFLIFGLYLMVYFYLGVLPANIDSFLQNLPGATQLGVGLAITFSLLTGTISMLIFGYFGGMIAQRITRKTLFIITNLVWISANAIISISPNYAFFLSFFLIAAIGNGAFLPIGFAIIGDLYKAEERGNKFGFMQLGLLLGNGLGVVIGGITGWRMGFLTASVLGSLVLIGYGRYGINVAIKYYDSNEIQVYNYKITFRDLVQLFKIRTVIGILLFVVCSGIATSTLANWSVFYLNLKLGNKGMAILLYLIAGLGALPGAVMGGSLGDIYFQSGKIRGRVIVPIIGVIVGTTLLLNFYLSPFILFGLAGFFQRDNLGSSWLGHRLSYIWKIRTNPELYWSTHWDFASPSIYLFAPELLFNINELETNQDLLTNIFPAPDPSQRLAIKSSLNNTISAILGPPGTGKSQTIAALVDEYLQTIYQQFS